MNSIQADFHLHTSFSSDSGTPMADMARAGADAGLSLLCFTEHMDLDFPVGSDGLDFLVDMDAYRAGFEQCCSACGKSVELLFGIELGLQRHLRSRLEELTARHPFDFVIGSAHIVDGSDPCLASYWEGRSEKEALDEYFEATLAYIRAVPCIDVCGHIDYAVRYAPEKNRNYSYRNHRDILDEILNTLISLGIGIELNTAGWRKGLRQPNPCTEILARYRELGGEILTIGSDAHVPSNVGRDFSRAEELLRTLGYRYYTVFRKRKPDFLPL